MPSLFSFPSEPHPVWSPLAEQIHTAVFHTAGKLSTVQGFVRHWAAGWKPGDPWPIPPEHRSPSLSLAEKWAGLAAIHDAYWKGDKIDPFPLPPDNDSPWLRLWPDNVEWQRTDLEPWTKWCNDGGLAYRRLMALPLSRLVPEDKPFLVEWLRDVTTEFVPAVQVEDQGGKHPWGDADPDTPFSPAKIADCLEISEDDSKQREALRKRLGNWRKANPGGGWIEDADAGGNRTKYLYRIGTVWTLVEDMKPPAKSGKSPAK